MKHMLKIAALTLCTVIGLSAVPVGALAQALPQAVIAVIDTQQIRRESLAGKDFSRQVEVIQAEFQTEYNRVSENLQKEEQDLQRQRSVISPEAFEARRSEFAAKFQAAQQSLEERQRAINLAISKANNELSRTLMPIFQRIAEARGANIVLERSQIVLPAPKADITDDVITELDKVLPSIDVEVAAAPAQ